MNPYGGVDPMLEFYLFPISYAFFTFPIAAALFTVPFLVVQYRRHGYVNKYRAFVLYLFLLYLMNAFYLILLPFPGTIHNGPPATDSYAQWIPFHFVQDIAKETAVRLTSPSTYARLLTERAFLQVVFNVLLFVPLGMFMRHYFRARWAVCLIGSFALSLFFEITQVSAVYGIFDYPYRLFDVDDLMTNTAGGMLGYLSAEALGRWLPRVDKLDEKTDLSRKRVSYTRRAIAFGVDWACLIPVLALLLVLRVPFSYVWVVLGYFVAVPYFSNGLTIGKWLVRIRLKGRAEQVALGELAARYGLLYLLAIGPNVAFVRAGVQSTEPLLMLPFALLLFGLDAVLAIHFFRCLFNRDRTPFYEERSGTTHVIADKKGSRQP